MSDISVAFKKWSNLRDSTFRCLLYFENRKINERKTTQFSEKLTPSNRLFHNLSREE